MNNQKTTIAGILVIVAGLANFVSQFLVGHAIDMNLITVLIAAVTGGIGLIHAADGTP
jgi:predicted PurR-regulated permease PerM